MIILNSVYHQIPYSCEYQPKDKCISSPCPTFVLYSPVCCQLYNKQIAYITITENGITEKALQVLQHIKTSILKPFHLTIYQDSFCGHYIDTRIWNGQYFGQNQEIPPVGQTADSGTLKTSLLLSPCASPSTPPIGNCHFKLRQWDIKIDKRVKCQKAHKMCWLKTIKE